MENERLEIGLAVSGGADSIALLVLMSELQSGHNFKAHVLHVDHGLRPDSADDAKFVKAMARKLKIPFHSVRANIIRRAGESVEMAARRVRLDFFETMIEKLKLDAIATGHHADDVAETFIMRLARGSGADGLAGLKRISHVGKITFIRPLLDLRTEQLREFLRSRNISWHEDSTNTDISIPRNNVRHRILPWLKENLDAHITEHICKTAAILRGDLTRERAECDCMNDKEKSVGNKNQGTDKKQSTDKKKKYALSISESVGFVRRPAGAIGIMPCECEMSRKALAGRKLMVRTWQEGDRIAPTGMGGKSRKIQDVYVTAKVPPQIRAELPLVVDAGTGEVLWVPGYRVAESVCVESAEAPSWHFSMT